MPKVRCRPVEVDAYQFTGDFAENERETLPRFIVDALRADVLQLHMKTSTWSLRLPDGAGSQPINATDWIVEEDGLLVIMEDAAFQKTFEIVE